MRSEAKGQGLSALVSTGSSDRESGNIICSGNTTEGYILRTAEEQKGGTGVEAYSGHTGFRPPGFEPRPGQPAGIIERWATYQTPLLLL